MVKILLLMSTLIFANETPLVKCRGYLMEDFKKTNVLIKGKVILNKDNRLVVYGLEDGLTEQNFYVVSPKSCIGINEDFKLIEIDQPKETLTKQVESKKEITPDDNKTNEVTEIIEPTINLPVKKYPSFLNKPVAKSPKSEKVKRKSKDKGKSDKNSLSVKEYAKTLYRGSDE